MAQGHHQIITKPRLYMSYPLYLYAMGGLDLVGTNSDQLTKEDIYRLISLNPSKGTTIPADTTIWYNLTPKRDMSDLEYYQSPSFQYANWLFDSTNTYSMILGHNFATTQTKFMTLPYGLSYLDYWEQDDGLVVPFGTDYLSPNALAGYGDGYATDDTDWQWNPNITDDITPIKNYDYLSVPEYDGWSAYGINFMPTVNPWDDWNTNSAARHMGITMHNNNGNESEVGSILYGKFWDFPQNAELSQSMSFSYGRKQSKSVSGKTLSSLQYDRPDEWVSGEPFGLGSTKNNPYRRSGVRTWDVAFTSLEPKHLMSQNIMENSNGYEAQDNHSTVNNNLDPVSSLYNSFNSVDFQNNVMKFTMGGHLPMVLCTDANDTSPSNWAIVRIKQDTLQITQKSPNLYSFKMTLEEQI